MADGGKTPVTRSASRTANASSKTGSSSAAAANATATVGSASRMASGSGEEQGRGVTVRPRSKSPTKPPMPSSNIPNNNRPKAARSSPRTAGGRISSQGSGPSSNRDSSAVISGNVSPTDTLQASGPHVPNQISNSVPATPHVHARRYSNEHRTPSPIPGTVPAEGSLSPRSVRSDSDSRVRPSQRPLVPVSCKFETGLAASRRRIPYSLGGDMLEKASGSVKEKLTREEEVKLTVDMQKLYKEKLLPTPESEERRSKFKAKLESILNQQWPGNDIKVHVFGSSGNLLCTSESDVDICITAPPKAIGRMCNLASCLASKGMQRVVCIPSAKVPIVKIWDPEFELACDMNINNTAAIENTRMMRTYVMIDPRVRPLAMVIKHWTRRRILNDAGLGGTLSSYTWISLLIHFLQSRIPPVLPSLQQRPHQCSVNQDGIRSAFADDVEGLSSYGESNKETLGELLFEFFRYFAHEFDYERNVISIRTGKTLLKTEKRWHLSVNNRLCVEEPFNTDRNLGNTADDISFRGLHLEIRRAFDLLCEAKLDECCEQYEFPPEQERFWQRPAPQPLPILTRSRSQTNRSSRSSEGGGGRSNNKGRHSKSGGSGRRASSAAAPNKTNMIFPAQLHNGQWLVEGGQISGQMIHEQLSQHMTMLQQQEAYFKLQQQHMAIAQSHAQSVVQLPQLQQSSPRHMQSLRENPRRSSAIEPAPLSAPLRGLQGTYAFPFPTTPRSGGATPAMAHAKHTTTNPSSPSLGIGRLTSTDHRRHHQRPMTPEAADMARSRSQPPVSSRDGTVPQGDQHHGRFIYPAGFGGALAGYPGLQHYQQQYLQVKEKHARQSQQQQQQQHQHQQQQGHASSNDQYDQARSRLDSLRLDGHGSEDREREATAPEYVGYFIDQFSPAQQIVALHAPTKMPQATPYEHRSDRLIPLDSRRLRTQDRERTSRSPSPILGSLSRDRSYSAQSGQPSGGQSSQSARQSGSLPTSLSSNFVAGGPIIIDGSGDSPSDTQPSRDSRPSSIYDSASSDVTATDHDRHSEFGGHDFTVPAWQGVFQPTGHSPETHTMDSSFQTAPAHHGFMQFGELPINSAHLTYANRDQSARSQRSSVLSDYGSLPRHSSTTSSNRDVHQSRAASTASQAPPVPLDTSQERAPEIRRANDTVTGLGLNLDSVIVSGSHESGSKREGTPETPIKGKQKSPQEPTSNASAAFHQQLPQGAPNGSAVKHGLANILKPAPLLSPVREVRTPSPTTNRTGGLLQHQSVVQVEGKQRPNKDKRASQQHARALSLSVEATRSKDEASGSVNRKPSGTSEGNAEGERRSPVLNQNSGSGTSTPSNPTTFPLPVSYSAMARKPSLIIPDQSKTSQTRPAARPDDSGSISPRTRSPQPLADSANGMREVNLANGYVKSDTQPPVARDEKSGARPVDSITKAVSQPLASQPKEPAGVTQGRQLRAQQTQALADSVDRLNISNSMSSTQSKGDKDARSLSGQRPLSYAQSTSGSPLIHQLGVSAGATSRELSSSTPAQQSGNAGGGNAGWQQAKRRGKKNNQTGNASQTHRRQTNSIGGTVLPSEIGERKGG